jgi:hypothetical protein
MSVDFESWKQNKELQDVFFNHPSLRDAFHNDATVYAWLQQYLHDRCTLEEAFIGIIIHLAQEKKKMFDEVVKLSQMTVSPKKFYVNVSEKEIKKLKEKGSIQIKKPVYEETENE